MLRYAVLRRALVLYPATHGNSLLRYARLCHTTHLNAMPRYVVLCCTTHLNAMPRYAVLCRIMHHNAMLRYAVLRRALVFSGVGTLPGRRLKKGTSWKTAQSGFFPMAETRRLKGGKTS